MNSNIIYKNDRFGVTQNAACRKSPAGAGLFCVNMVK